MVTPEPPSAPAEPRRRDIFPALPRWAALLCFLGIVAAAVVPRATYAETRSLVLDEFHTTYHAFNLSEGLFLEALSADNHPPLSFFTVGVAAELLGTSEIALRLPSLALGLLELAAVYRLARMCGARRSRGLLAAALLATSSMHFDYGTQARMYVPFSAFMTFATVSLLAMVTGTRSAVRSAAALAVFAGAALHTHYFAFHYLAILGAAGLLALHLQGRPIAPLVIAMTAAGASFLPWGTTGFLAQLGHNLPPGGDDIGVLDLARALGHLFTHNSSMVGGPGQLLFVLCSAFALLLSAYGARVLLSDRIKRPVGLVLASTAFVVPLAAWIAASINARSGFTWHYVLPSGASAAVLCAVGARDVFGMAFALLQVLAGSTLIGIHVDSPATENFRGAIAHAVQLASEAEGRGESAVIVAAEYQPRLFPQGRPFDYYAGTVASPAEPPPRLPLNREGSMVADRSALDGARHVLLISRSVPREHPLRKELHSRFGEPAVSNFGYGVDVIEYSREP